ncbi:hypothetical protein NLI96_g9978 [Meripilus lineatus]|uniref:Major facilitator superfamily (MFS) profile domain-containing protein n=1 Tax=Meripilus lineatus TaxID=2056292 RepID=A0AAD5UVZ3_9APHY|nr:hypothetical protein NLI96_g9978 [Physisporinus lineatus]
MDKLKRTTYTPRYPKWMIGRPILIASSALASFGDVMCGYTIIALQVEPPFIKRFLGKTVTLAQVQADHTGVKLMIDAVAVICFEIPGFFAALGSAYLCDHLGRRMSLRIGGIIYFIAAFVQMFSKGLPGFIFARLIQGVGGGILSVTVPILQSEIAPEHSRGLFICIEHLCMNAGHALSAWVGYGFFFMLPSDLSWRGPYIVQAVLSFILVLWTYVLPETPRWLIKNGFEEEGLGTLADLHGTGDVNDPTIRGSYGEISAAIEYEARLGQATWSQLFTQYPRRIIVGAICQFFAQFNGINAILYLMPINLFRAGGSIKTSLLYVGIAAVVNCLGTVSAMFLIDRWGRRPFLIFGSIALAACLATAGGVQIGAERLPEGRSHVPYTSGIFAGGPIVFRTFIVMTLSFVAFCLYLFVFSASAEIFPLRARGKGAALSSMVNWLCGFIVTLSMERLFRSLPAGGYFFFMGFCIMSGIFVFFVCPETAYLSLEQLGRVFGDKVSDSEEEIGVAPAMLGVPEGRDSESTLRPSIDSTSPYKVKKESSSLSV